MRVRLLHLVAMGTLAACATALALAACAHTSATMTDFVQPVQRTPTCRSAIHMYLTADEIPGPYERVAFLKVVGNDFAGRQTLLYSLTGKAAKLGANGLLYRNLNLDPGLLGDPSGEAMAIWVPSDTARIAGECAAEARRLASHPAAQFGQYAGTCPDSASEPYAWKHRDTALCPR
jgi:hypothetical protein